MKGHVTHTMTNNTHTPGYTHGETTLKNMPGRYIGIHVLRPAVGVNLNSGMDGTPKTAIVNGTKYMRVSSQAKKRAVREWMIERTNVQDQAVRTRRLPAAIADVVSEHKNVDYDTALNYAISLLIAHGKNRGLDFTVKINDPERTSELAFITRPAVEELATIACDHFDELTPIAEKVGNMRAKEEAKNTGRKPSDSGKKITGLPVLGADISARVTEAFTRSGSAEIALSGRMLTAVPQSHVDGAISVAHSITVDAMKTIHDEWTCKDDWQRDLDTHTGAGMLKTATLGSGVFYEWAVCDREQLRTNLAPTYTGDEAGLVEACQRTEEMFVHGFTVAVPRAHSRNTGSNLAPSLVVTTVSDTPPLITPFHYEPLVDDVIVQAGDRVARSVMRHDRYAPMSGGLVEWGVDVNPASVSDVRFPDTFHVMH